MIPKVAVSHLILPAENSLLHLLDDTEKKNIIPEVAILSFRPITGCYQQFTKGTHNSP